MQSQPQVFLKQLFQLSLGSLKSAKSMRSMRSKEVQWAQEVNLFLVTYFHRLSMLVQSRVSTGRDVPLSLCPGTKRFSCPGVPLSRDKGKSKCPGTNTSVPGRLGTKSLSQKNTKNRKRTFQNRKMTRFPVLEHNFPVLEHPFLF